MLFIGSSKISVKLSLEICGCFRPDERGGLAVDLVSVIVGDGCVGKVCFEACSFAFGYYSSSAQCIRIEGDPIAVFQPWVHYVLVNQCCRPASA